MKKLVYLLFLLPLFFSCKKDDKTFIVSYSITSQTPGSGLYSLRYTLADGTLKSEGPISSETWISPNLTGYKRGAIISFYLDASNGSYEMYIYINGEMVSHSAAEGGFGEQLLEAQIPN